MQPEELFENFDADKQRRYEAELVSRYGPQVVPHIEESKRRMKGWTKADAARVQQEWRRFGPALVELIDAGAAVDDPQVLDVIDGHYRWVCNFWTPNRGAYTGLGQLYVDHPGFRANYDAQDPRLAEFMRDAMAAYAQARL